MQKTRILSPYYQRYVVYKITILVILELLVRPGLAVSSKEVALYGLYETVIDYKSLTGQSHPYEDSFYGVDLEATFTSSSGRHIIWWGFYDGDGQGGQSGDIWKIRFMPDELGKWDFTWQFRDGSLSGSGSLRAVDNALHPAKPGPLRHDPDIPQWLVTADGSRHVFLNMYADDTDFPGIRVTYDQYLSPQKHIDKCKDNEFDVMFTGGGIQPTNRDLMPMDENNPFPYIDTVSYTPRLQGWHHMEEGLWQKCYEQGIYVFEFWGFYGGNEHYDLHKKRITISDTQGIPFLNCIRNKVSKYLKRGTAYQNRVIKYWLSRTAPYYIFLYNIGFELPEYVNVPSWPVERAQFIKDLDPWDHLITGHELHRWSYGNSAVIDFSALQNDDAFHERALAVWNSPSQPHPHCNECIWNAKWQTPGTETSHRKDLWDGITAGMSYGFFARDSETGLTSFRHANAFLKSGVKWWTMSPHDEVVKSGKAYVLAKLGVEYIIYSSSGSNFALNLPVGSYHWRWFNPASGTWSKGNLLSAQGGSAIFEKPDCNDWVLYISSSRSDNTPPGVTARLPGMK